MSLNEEFIKFVNYQDKDQPIDHTSFESCAIGDFVTEFQLENDLGLQSQMNADLFNYLGDTPCGKLQKECPTYGHLQNWIKENIN